MHILIVNNKPIPVSRYGGTQRDIWWLGRELVQRGHKVTYLVPPGSYSPFAEVIYFDPKAPNLEDNLEKKIPQNVDIVNVHFILKRAIRTKPCLVVIHGNSSKPVTFIKNTVFISRNHARRHNCRHFLYNGLDPRDYGKPDFNRDRNYVHFLGKAAWPVKNVTGAIRIARKAKEKIEILGGYRFNLNMGLRLTLDPNAHFNGMVGGEKKNRLINGSRGLVFPVTWNEPFGLAVIESLYFGCPVFATPFGSLPELVPAEYGFLSDKEDELIEAVRNAGSYNRKRCHEYIMENHTSKQMTDKYLLYFNKVLNGETINENPPYFSGLIQDRNLPVQKAK
ncbi:MAG TPA: glycosyltransferase [Spirochaetota bacterium]|nr:glycosyltransferase [Spirochaetota bacterium]